LARFPSFSLGGRERSILQGVQDHLSTVRSCVVAYQDLVKASAERGASAEPLYKKVFELEADANGIHRGLSQRIAEGAFFGGVREDILNLLATDDSIANTAKDAARLLVIGETDEGSLATVLANDHMTRFQQALLDSVDALVQLISALQTDKKTVLSKVHFVEDYEEQADIEKDHLLRELFGMRKTLDPVSIIQLRDFVFASDNIADNAENSSDVVLVLVAKGYG
jgi:predicted phosphate transport protein (TIGR00153 family)